MRLWSLHPKYLDRQGLLALWREGLLAQAVLRGQTRGYTRHPQLERFVRAASPEAAIARYLEGVAAEAEARSYRFDRSKIGDAAGATTLTVTDGQLAYEWSHLLAKLAERDSQRRERLASVETPEPHPLFSTVPGPIEPWERPRG